MKAPSFRCSERFDGSLILHYYSERPGLEHIVIGIVKVSRSQCPLSCHLQTLRIAQAVANKLHGQDVEVTIVKHKGEDCDHVQYEILEKVKTVAVVEPVVDNFDQLMSFENKISPFTFCKAFPFHIVFDKNMVLRQVGTHTHWPG